METAEILRRLERNRTGRFPKRAVEEAVARREEITPALLRVLEDCLGRAEELAKDGDYMAHLFAMFLLAQFRETRAYPLVVRFALLPAEQLDGLTGDFLTEDLGRILASVSGGDLSGIQSIIENNDAFPWARDAALTSLVTLVAAGVTSRDEVIVYFGSLFRGKLVRECSRVWDALVTRCTDLWPAELMDDLEKAFADGLVDPSSIGLDDVRSELARGKETVLAELARHRSERFVEDSVKEMESWAYFHDEDVFAGETEAQRWVSTAAAAAPGVHRQPEVAEAAPFRREAPKTGRNEPCPCGSGKKYKKCCGA